MMEAAHLGDRHNPPGFWSLDGAWLGRILLQAQVRATPMIIVGESSQVAIQAGFAPYDHVIQALSPNGADHPLNVGPLPGRAGRREHLFDAHRLHLLHEVRPEDPIPVAQQITRRRLPREGLAQLLGGPLCRRTIGDAKMQNAPPASTRNTYRTWKRMVGTGKKSTETMDFTWLSRKVRQVGEGGLWRRTRYLLTLVSPISMPSLSNSP